MKRELLYRVIVAHCGELRSDQLEVPSIYRSEVLKLGNELALAGHIGITKTSIWAYEDIQEKVQNTYDYVLDLHNRLQEVHRLLARKVTTRPYSVMGSVRSTMAL